MRVFADLSLSANIGAFADPDTRPDLRAGTDHRAGIHPGRGIDFRISRDHSPEINAGLRIRERPAFHRLARPGVPGVRVGREDHRAGKILKLGKRFFRGVRHNQNRSTRRRSLFQSLRIRHKSDMRAVSLFNRTEPFDADRLSTMHRARRKPAAREFRNACDQIRNQK